MSHVSPRAVVIGIGFGADGWENARQIANELRQTAKIERTPIIVVLVSSGNGHTAEISTVPRSDQMIVFGPGDLIDPHPDCVYFPVPGLAGEFRNGKLTATQLPDNQQSAPIDHFFSSLASEFKDFAVGVVLSGTGTDGTLGLKSIGDAGGMTIALCLESLAERSRPPSAATLGDVDHVLPADAIAVEILHHAQHMHESTDIDDADELNRQIIVAIPRIAEAVEKHTQNDFKHYKTTTLARRIRRRLHVLKLGSVDDYIELLRTSREEAQRLFRDLLISVTSFFRDPQAFDALAREVLTPLVQQHQGEAPIRIWVPGCATGQEAYSIAILLAEILEQTQRKVGIQIFATDLDERALVIARGGGYPIGIQDEVAASRLRRFFVKRGNRFFVAKQIRDLVVFSTHNLISDPPFTKVDLISCRNLLIYLGEHLQKKLIPLFHYGLKPNGFLFLGPAENLTINGELFRTLHSKHRLYHRRLTVLDDRKVLDIPRVSFDRLVLETDTSSREVDLFRFAQHIILGEFSPQWVVVDDDGQIMSLSSDPTPFLRMSAGQFKNNLISMAHESLRIGLRSAFSEAKKHRRRALAEDLSVPADGGLQRVHITVQPMPEMGSHVPLHLVLFHRIGTPLQTNPESGPQAMASSAEVADVAAAQLIEQLEAELVRTHAALDRTVQELEASNEELKSSNEELLSMNEELQAANEELESSKEELQSSNESLVRSNNDTQNLLRATQIATLFLDNELCIRGFTPAATQIYPLVATDVGRSLAQFAPSIAGMPPLPDPMSLTESQQVEHTIEASSGDTYIRRVTPYRAPGGANDGMVVTFLDVTELTNSIRLFKSLVDVTSQIVWVTDANGRISEDSPSWREFTGQSYELWNGGEWSMAIHPEDLPGVMEAWQAAIDSQQPLLTEYRLQHHSGVYRWTQVRAVPNRLPNGKVNRWVGMNIDIDDQKRQHLALADSEAHLRRVINNQLGLVGVVDPNGVLLEIDERSLAIAHTSRDQVVGHHFAEAPWWNYDPEVVAQVRQALSRALTGEVVRYDVSLYSPTDAGVVIDFMIAPVFDQSGQVEYLIASGVDIRERKAAELVLEQRAKLATLHSSLATALSSNAALNEILQSCCQQIVDELHVAFARVWLYDEGTQLLTLTASAGLYTHLDGAHAQIPLGKYKIGRIAEQQQSILTNDVQRDPNISDHQWAAREGMTAFGGYPLIIAGRTIGVLAMFSQHEFTAETFSELSPMATAIAQCIERKRSEDALADSLAVLQATNTKFQVMFDQSFHFAGILDLEGNLLDANQQALEGCGYHAEQVIGKKFWETPWWAGNEEASGEIRQAVACAATGETFAHILPYWLANGSQRWVDFRITPAVNSKGEVLYVCPSGMDITDRLEVERALRLSEQRAQAASASKSEFLANMSHEIRTPMTAILGYADLLQDLVEPQEARHYLQTIRRNGNYLLEIINDILDLSKIEAGKLDIAQEEFAPDRLIEDVRGIMNVRANDSGINFEVQYQSALPPRVRSDAKRLKQILINLLGNAIKFTPQGGVQMIVQYVPGHLTAPWLPTTTSTLSFHIVDTGIGMSEQQLKNLFQPFSQGDGTVNRKFGGTGLGLAISRRLAEMLGGTITVKSQLGRGSSFTVTIEVVDIAECDGVDASPPQHDCEAPQPSEVALFDAEILIVDDRRDIRYLSKTFLHKAGARVSEAEDGEIAIKLVKGATERGTAYHLILLDMQMPRLDGYQTAAALRQLGYMGPIIALTADAMQGDMSRCLQAGCNDYLSKPIDRSAMLAKVHKYLQHRQP